MTLKQESCEHHESGQQGMGTHHVVNVTLSQYLFSKLHGGKKLAFMLDLTLPAFHSCSVLTSIIKASPRCTAAMSS